jgi:hypothetical protein
MKIGMLSISKVDMLLSSLDPELKSFVPSKKVKCNSVFFLYVLREAFMLL